MVFWALAPVCFAWKQAELYGSVSDSLLVSVLLQFIYLCKFFYWETGYFCSMDIQHDRAGYYLCWGCLVWVPSVYTSASFYMVNQPLTLGPVRAFATLFTGLLCVWINYRADSQRQEFRKNPKEPIWGRTPVCINATYRTTDGKMRKSTLLASGWWGVSRHFHYMPEIMAAFFWSCPGNFNNYIPFFYLTFLTILLFDRSVRDDAKCASKYGKYWDQYKALVPYKIIPGVF
jgi:7-dehydrocholesterol reductase